MKTKISAIEYYLPPKIEDNFALKNDNPDWQIEAIEEKTGIKQRHIVDSGQTALDMGVIAAEKLFPSGVKKEEVDFLIFVTQSPDYFLPTSACILQDRLGLRKSTIAFDLNLGCSGFIYGLAVGGSLIESGLGKFGLIICSETYSKYIDKNDRTCRPLFGDAASAILIGGCDDHILGPFELGTDGSGFSDLIVGKDCKLFMDGAKVFMFTMDMVPKCVDLLLKKAAKAKQDIDLFIFHQASKVVLENIKRKLEIPDQKVFVNHSKIGNTVSASIPIALKDALDQNRIKQGDLIALVGFGVGYSWGGCIIEWR